MDGENHGKPYFLMDDLGGKPHYFRKHPYLRSSPILFFRQFCHSHTKAKAGFGSVPVRFATHPTQFLTRPFVTKNQKPLTNVWELSLSLLLFLLLLLLLLLWLLLMLMLMLMLLVDAGVAVVFVIVLGRVVLLSLLFLLLLLLPLLMLLLRRQLPQNPATERTKPCFQKKIRKVLDTNLQPLAFNTANPQHEFPFNAHWKTTRTRWKTRQSLVS